MTRFAIAGSIVAALFAAGLPAGAQSSPTPDTTAIVGAAAEYVRGYQKDFAFLVADEDSQQTVVSPYVDGNKKRSIKGEMFLTFLEVDQEWVAVHDISEVDGVALSNNLDVRALLAKASLQSVAAQVVANNARFNIGSVQRNINEPTFALLALSPRRLTTFTFDRGDVDRRDPARVLVTLKFKERGDSPIVRTPNRTPVYSRGELVVEAATGRIVRTRIQFDIGPIHAEQDATYSPDERLGLWVPTLYTEKYSLTMRGRIETTTCRTILSNYRRFAATGRIK